MHAGFSVSSFFKNNNINTIFTLCGGHISPILVGCESEGIDIIEVRDEASTVFAADAVSRLTDSVGVAIVTAGPGVTNTITAIKNAQLAQSPLILIGGAAATLLRGKGSLQDIDQMALIKPHVKSAVSVSKTRDIVPSLTNALNTAMSGVPGPVFVELPIDLLYPEESIREQYANQLPSNGIVGKAMTWYVNRHLNNMFSDRKSSIKIRKKTRLLGRQKDIDNAALAIVNAKKPLILLGNQVTQNKEALSQFIKSLNKFSIPTYTSGMSRGCFNEDDAFFMRHNRKHALKNADVVLTIGLPLDFRLGYGFSINKNAKIIAINKSKTDMKKNRKPFIGIHGDPTRAMCEIAKVINPPKCTEWLKELNVLEKNRDDEIIQQSEMTTDFVNPIKLCTTINNLLDDNSILIADGGDFVGTASYVVRPKGPLSWLDPGPFGTLGVGGGFALGAKNTYKDKEVWIIYGDGACAFSLAEFDTFVRHKLPVIAIVGNDASWQQIAREQVDMLGSPIGTNLANTAYHQVAIGYGGKGYAVEDPNELESVLLQAKEDARNGHPVLVNVRIGKTDFRKGSISV
ncbi:MAG TPA: thiamine pyrophosphate-binding protein [Candidatus Marinimicrobia bacterium]|nr:thiamine pyrophosphate-binding protein [Candidatus Neomarinimicrobiota bacterium]HIL86410.1 thiamine pyrophosphate-binding protein [Candidatus Neomarinimicrobiota bacterium]